MSERRQKLIMAAITAVTLGAVLVTGCDPSTTGPDLPSQSPVRVTPRAPAQVLPEECLVLYGQAPYDVTYEDGTRVHVPAGRVLVDELLGEDTATLRLGCTKIRQQWIKDHR